ncbi:DNA-3-methyladenine glycosylase [Lactobacillus xylocopicola]|uniref:Putative 3-methyladenine DNA glycosylase n=1 Tax=Lactobacillus xylocopicola TaxID=2976676 RepID=A0ABM8BF40_9LACO|nr:DNA-3-methyladenine glycosylase [Lactobacillus xylocopicola]BDR59860.1 putative 3-methyladenine DNA glycosylase [Lactobacillus xylocopicola]
MDYSTFFTNRSTTEITADIIGRPLTYTAGSQTMGGYIVEAEAYLGKEDRAAHSYGGHRSLANEGLYRSGGTIYLYAQRQYFFFNVATQAGNEPQGILIRAIEPVWGIEQMLVNRHGKGGVLLTNGPAKMMQAFGIHDLSWNLHSLQASPFTIELDSSHQRPARQIVRSPRIGVNQSEREWADKPLRFYVAGNPYVSRMKKRNWRTDHGWQ